MARINQNQDKEIRDNLRQTYIAMDAITLAIIIQGIERLTPWDKPFSDEVNEWNKTRLEVAKEVMLLKEGDNTVE